MKLNCCWLYAIKKYGYPPSMPDTFKVLEEMKALGFDAVELEGVGEQNMMEVWDNRAALKQKCEDLGLRVMNFCPILPDLISYDDAQRDKALDLFKRGVELGAYFGADFVQTDTYHAPVQFVGDRPYDTGVEFGKRFRVQVEPGYDPVRLWNRIVETMHFCSEEAAKAGLGFLVEPRVGENVSNTDAMLRLIDHVQHDNLGVVLDTGHQNAQKEIMPLAVYKLGSRIRYVHASDNDGRDNDHLAIGRGTIDWEALFQALKDVGFDGWIGVDVGVAAEEMDEQYLESKTALEALIAGVSG